MRSAAKRPMSAAEQFKGVVTSEAVPKGWRCGLERSCARGAKCRLLNWEELRCPSRLVVAAIVARINRVLTNGRSVEKVCIAGSIE